MKKYDLLSSTPTHLTMHNTVSLWESRTTKGLTEESTLAYKMLLWHELWLKNGKLNQFECHTQTHAQAHTVLLILVSRR